MSYTTDPIPGAGARAGAAPTELRFEQGYERLQAIAARLGEDAVPVSEMCDLFAEGKGLEQALTEFLDTERARVEAIERGEGVHAFRISRGVVDTPATTPAPTPIRPVPSSSSAPAPAQPAEDDIPF